MDKQTDAFIYPTDIALISLKEEKAVPGLEHSAPNHVWSGGNCLFGDLLYEPWLMGWPILL